MMRAKLAPFVIIATLVFCLASSTATADSESFALRAGRILPVSPDLPAEIEDGVIIVRDGRIAAVGSHADIDVSPDLPLIEIPDGTITPGFVAAASDLGGPHRGDESVAAGYRAVDAFDRFDDYAVTLAAGVTSVHVGSGTHRLLTGQSAVVRLGGPPADRVLQAQTDLMINLSPAVQEPPADVTYPFPASADVAIVPPRRQRPASRLDQLLALDESIRNALAETEPETFSIHAQALARAWRDNLPLRFRVDEPADALEAIKFLRQHQRPGYMVGGDRIGGVLAAVGSSRVPLVYRPSSRFRAPGGDIGTDPNAQDELDLALLSSTVAQFAIAPPAGQRLADLRLTAVQAARGGLPKDVALRAITRTAAEILGVDDRVGSLAVGKDADLVVLTGDPLETSSHVQQVYIRGRQVFRPPSSSALVVKAATIWAGPDRWIRDGQVLVEGGKIVAVGTSVPHPPFARVIDLRPGGFVTPGFIDARSHLGLEGDRTAIGTDLRLSRLVGVADVTDDRVAAAGITTVLMAPYGISSKGTTVAAVKTAGESRETRIIRDPAAVLLHISQTADPLGVTSQLDGILASGQKYLDSWTKYEKDLKAFVEKQKKGEKTTNGTEEKSDVAEESAEPDPVTGTWQTTITGVPTPEPVRATIVVRLIDSNVEGRITYTSVGLTGRLRGSFDGKHLSAEIEPDESIPGLNPPIEMEADLTEEDRMKGTITAMGITAQIQGRRVDKRAVELKVVSRRTRGKDGRPLPPKRNEALEPLKALLEKKIPTIVQVTTSAQIREVLASMVDKRELPVALLDAEGASAHASKLAEKDVTVIVPPSILRTEKYRDYHQADNLNRSGVPIAFQSDAEDGARNLPSVVMFAVERGLDANAALAALTIDAAKAFKIDDRVGRIEPGKDADLVLFSSHPFVDGGRVLRVIVAGKEVKP